MSVNLTDLVVSRGLLIQLGQAALYIINRRVAEGKFLPGSTGTNKYSTTPLPLPAGALTAKGIKTLNTLLDSDEATAFTAKSGRLWIVLQEGYKQLRQLAGRETDHVTLNWSGAMMRGLTITEVSVQQAAITLGWNDSALAERASYHEQLGAGRSRKTHKFLGLTPAEVKRLQQQIERHIHQQA